MKLTITQSISYQINLTHEEKYQIEPEIVEISFDEFEAEYIKKLPKFRTLIGVKKSKVVHYRTREEK